MYTEGDTTALGEIFTDGAVDGSMEGLEAIQEGYDALFSKTTDRRLWFLNDEYLGAEIDGLWWHYKYKIEYEGEKIASFTYQEVPLEEVRAL
jgi:hypothetical protein